MAVTQANRQLRVNTPLGADKLLIVEMSGREAISELFHYQLTLLAENATTVEFDKLIGKPITVEMELPGNKKRFFNGLCAQLAAGRRDDTFTQYRMELVPQFWLLSRRAQSRIFQQISVPDILKQVLKGLDVKWEIQGSFFQRDYCVQYRESDFAFASRLMEEEGIYYYFAHADKGHTLVVANTPQSHADVPEYAKAIYEEIRGGNREEMRVTDWEKVQELRSGKVTLWDHCFELPQKNLEAQKTIQESVSAGKVTHKLKLADNDKLELYDYPGAYAQRFDGVDPGGGARAADLQNIFQDNTRVATFHIQREAAESLEIHGTSNCRQFGAGQKFTLERHFDADGVYVLTGVQFDAKLAADYRTAQGEDLTYENRFTCIPLALPFRPQLNTPKPTVAGTQTATVVGPAGEEIFCDKYGRVKVQFHWDRQGKKNADSSCWIRVATIWAGKGYGIINVPRIGQEVIVDFLEGDPDQPIIVGSVYNADEMPAFELPAKKMVMGFKSNSTPGGGGYNELTMDDTKGTEKITIHGQYDMNTTVEHDQTTTVHNNRTDVIDVDDSETVGGNQKQHVVKDQTVNIDANRTETVGKNETITVSGNRTRSVSGTESVTVTKTRTHTVGINEAITVGAAQEVTVGGMRSVSVGGLQNVTVGLNQSVNVGRKQNVTIGSDHTISVGGSQSETIAKDHDEKVSGNLGIDAGGDASLNSGKKIAVQAADQILLTCGDASLMLKKDGTIVLKGKDINVEGTGKINVKADGDMVLKGSKIGQN